MERARKWVTGVCRSYADMPRPEDGEPQTIHPNKEQLSRRPINTRKAHMKVAAPQDNVIIVPHVQISPNESHLFNRAISSGGGLLA
ncbi:hypothetical protein COOONC_07783, partial [Cooperia oncophora]